ncbi:hypothetical protein CJU89_0748 [Yarrowia sp. B02]|nr:hypothetical protein CJU89_0748 [Yarrowia sp. B02]
MKTEGVWREKDYKHMFMRTAALMEKLADATVAELQLSGKRDYDAIFQRQSVIFASQMFEIALPMVKERAHELFLQPKKDDPKNLYDVVGTPPNPSFFFERSPYLKWETLQLADRLDPSELCKADTQKVLGEQQDTSFLEGQLEDMEDNVRNLEGQMASLKKSLASKERENNIVKGQNQAHKLLLAKQEVLLAAMSSKLGPDAAKEILDKADKATVSAPRKLDPVPSHRAARQQRAKAAAAAREGSSSKESTPDAEPMPELKPDTEPKTEFKTEFKTEPKKFEFKPEPKKFEFKTESKKPEENVQKTASAGNGARANPQPQATPKKTPAPKAQATPSKAMPAKIPQVTPQAAPAKAAPVKTQAPVKAQTAPTKATPVKARAAPVKAPQPSQPSQTAKSTPAKAPSTSAEGEQIIAAATQALQDYRELWAQGAPSLTLPPNVLDGAKNGDINAIRELTAAVEDLKIRHEFEKEQKKKNAAKTSTLNEVLASRQAPKPNPSKATLVPKASQAAPAASTTPQAAQTTPTVAPTAAPAPKRAFIMNYPGVPMPVDMNSIASQFGHQAPSSVSVTQPAASSPALPKPAANYSMSHMSDFEMSLDSVSFANDTIPHKCVFVMGRFAKHLPVDVMVQEVFDRCGPTSKEFLLTCRADDDDWECVYDCLKGFVDRQTPIPFPAYVQDISQ